MRSLCIDTGDQQSHTIWSSSVLLGVDLRPVGDAAGDLGEGNRAVVGQARGERLLLHEVGQDAGVGGETGEGDTEVGVYRDDLLLVRRELLCVSLQL